MYMLLQCESQAHTALSLLMHVTKAIPACEFALPAHT